MMKDGTRAIILAVAVVVLAAILAYLLQDGGIFTTSTSTSIIGKFGYDAARDFSKGRSNGNGAGPVQASDQEEHGD